MKKLIYFPFVILLAVFAGCKKDNPHQFVYLVYENNVFTDVYITANGSTTTIHPGASATFTGEMGAKFDYTAVSNGQTSDGKQLGVQLQ